MAAKDLSSGQPAPADCPKELLVSGGMLLDGTGAPARAADVVVRGDRIVGVYAPGCAPHLPRACTVDARGLAVAPGFIDLHTHADFSVKSAPGCESALHQGVTTLVTGNCGMSPFPVATGRPAAESWPDLRQFARAVTAARPAVHIAPLVGHGALRAAVVGHDQRAASAAEVEAMRSLLAQAARHGVFGMSTGLLYAPGRFAERAEIEALAAEAAVHGLLYATHMRNEADELLDAVAESLAVARATGVRLQISHLKAMGHANRGKVREALRLIDEARGEGIDVAADVYPYTASSTRLTSRLPGWALDGGTPALLERLADPGQRAWLHAEVHSSLGRVIVPEEVVLAQLTPGPYEGSVGRSIAEVARGRGTDPASVVLDVLAEHGGDAFIINHAMGEADVEAVLRHPHTAVASDGWVLQAPAEGHPHPRSFGTFARVLARYVRERGVLALPEAVRRMTALPAARLGLADRGTIRPGGIADLVVFDPEQVVDRATFADPSRYAAGVHTVIVAGEPALWQGQPTPVRAGQVLRRPGAADGPARPPR
ncbi:amidohydrolase family protein [Peterkaempfera sp. SMS 1(5)a]|uniref:N-acyl-D-amino-acid deacylase family protein n=1 Tax=Peterkaempfera podocarpi TaxID=3232308 RepID=UPI0036704870